MIPMRGIALAALAAAACQNTGSDQPTADVPALITESTADSRAELREAVATALPGRRVLLADNAFEESSLLVVERRRRERIEGLLSAGVPDDAADQKPHRFRLVVATDGCELVHLDTGKRYPLQTTRCRPEPAAAD